MSTLPKKPRLPRIERSDDFHIDDETTHLWAISYADFLMVLLSFFILFFSVDTEDKNSLIRKIVAATESTSAEGGQPGYDRQPSSKGAALERISNERIVDHLKDFKIQVKTDKQAIEFLFPDNIFQAGHYELPANIKKQLGLLIEKLKPFETQIDITIVGHTDSTPVRHMRTRVVNDNFALSVIRATRALQFAVDEGISPSAISAKGSADNRRHSRTLSVIVKAAATPAEQE